MDKIVDTILPQQEGEPTDRADLRVERQVHHLEVSGWGWKVITYVGGPAQGPLAITWSLLVLALTAIGSGVALSYVATLVGSSPLVATVSLLGTFAGIMATGIGLILRFRK
jgi:hypothetical protein